MGILEDAEITLDNVVIPCCAGPLDLYFIIFVVDRAFRGFKANRLLVESLLDRLEEYAAAGIWPRRICANAFTPEGVGLCRSLGMVYLQPHQRTGLIFELGAAELAQRLTGRPHLRDLLQIEATQPYQLASPSAPASSTS